LLNGKLNIYCTETFANERYIYLTLSSTNANNFVTKNSKLAIKTTSPDYTDFNITIFSLMPLPGKPLNPFFRIQSTHRGTAYWILIHNAPWAIDVTFD
jgi:hypothetical protein